MPLSESAITLPAAKVAEHPQNKCGWHLAATVSTCASPNGCLRRPGLRLDAAGRYLILVHAVTGHDACDSPSTAPEPQLARARGRTKNLQRWDWELLRTAVQRVIDQGGIGRPAALRLTVHTQGTEADARRCLQGAEGVAAAWFGGRPDTTYSIGGPGGGSAGGPGTPTVTALKWASGQCAILSVSAGPHGRVGGNVMLMGSRGTVYHEIGDSESRLD